jgi:hypothetical protein
LAQSLLAASFDSAACQASHVSLHFIPSGCTALFPLSDCFRFGSQRHESAHLRALETIKNKMQNERIHQYNGYAVNPSAHRLADGSFSSNLLLERTDNAHADGRYQFYSLDYFASEEQALQYSTRWARNWVDTRG